MMFLVHLLVLQWRSYGTNEEDDHLIKNIKINKNWFFWVENHFLKVEDDLKCGLGPY